MTGHGDSLKGKRAAAAEDSGLVADAANALDATEFELFELAHRAWFAAPGRKRALERDFGHYMMRGEAPHWVRHFARRVLALPTEVERRRLHHALRPARAAATPPAAGRLYVLATAGIVAVFLLLLLDVSYDPNTSAPITCRGGPGMQSFVAAIARAFGSDLTC